MSPRRTAKPRLTPEVLADTEKLGEAIDAVLLADPEHRRATRRILKRQAALHRLVDDAGWAAYLDLEQAVNERATDDYFALVRWAWKEGRRRRLRTQRP